MMDDKIKKRLIDLRQSLDMQIAVPKSSTVTLEREEAYLVMLITDKMLKWDYDLC